MVFGFLLTVLPPVIILLLMGAFLVFINVNTGTTDFGING